MDGAYHINNMRPILIYGPPQSGKKTKAMTLTSSPFFVDCAIHPLFQFDQFDSNKTFIVEHVDMYQNINQLLNLLANYNFIFTARRIKPILNLAKHCEIIFTTTHQSIYPSDFEEMLSCDDPHYLKHMHRLYYLYGLGVDERWIYKYHHAHNRFHIS